MDAGCPQGIQMIVCLDDQIHISSAFGFIHSGSEDKNTGSPSGDGLHDFADFRTLLAG